MLEVLDFLNKRVKEGIKIVKDKFSEINKSMPGLVSAVDGGACIIADGGSWLISKIKTGCVQYDDGRRVQANCSVKDYYYTLIKDGANFEHSMSELKCDFKNIRELGEVPAIIMRTLEFIKALEVIRELPSDSLLLIDGLLAAETKDQEKALMNLEAQAKARGVNVVGLAKTFRQGVNGRSVIGSLLSERPDTKWVYDLGELKIVKLHEKARYAYAISAFKHVDLSKVLPVLVYYSRDPELIGYPYPLLRVDRDARISSHERANEINKLRILCKKHKFDFIEMDERSTSMHSVMDSGKYR